MPELKQYGRLSYGRSYTVAGRGCQEKTAQQDQRRVRVSSVLRDLQRLQLRISSRGGVGRASGLLSRFERLTS